MVSERGFPKLHHTATAHRQSNLQISISFNHLVDYELLEVVVTFETLMFLCFWISELFLTLLLYEVSYE